ncbi:CU044_5270 family protein [Amycolatopsis sp. NPDC059657]|uniref:CU044_5270 family protein n=1 Tax=Amycolatopsis sp. NPDC059657 TaxID=3346899 RepID=UPI0036733A6E
MNELDQALDQLHREARDSHASLSGARAKLMAAVDAEAALPQLRPRRRRLVLPVAAAAAAVLAVTAVVVQVRSDEPAPQAAVPPSSEAPVAPPSEAPVTLVAAEVLNKAADLSVGAVDQPVGPGQYRYINKHAWNTRGQSTGVSVDAPDQTITGSTYLIEQRFQTWIPADEKQVWLERREVLGPLKWVAGTKPESETTPPAIMDTDTGERQGPCGDFFPKAKPKKVCGDVNDSAQPAFYRNLPNDPDKMFARLKDMTKGRGSSPSAMFHFGLLVLEDGLMPAEQRANWYRALAKIDGVKVVETAANLDGRTGIALGIDGEHERRDLIIDPKTGAFIGVRSVAGEHPYDAWIKPGTVTEFSAVTTGVAGTIGQAPAN